VAAVPVPDAIAFARAALPPAPARVLEIGAGDGALAGVLRAAGYDVTAIDPRGEGAVQPLALLDLAPGEPFDAAVAMTSLHHVEPLEASVEHLAGLLRPGARLVVDEYDVEALDERAAAWWLRIAGEDRDPAEHVAHMRAHIASVARIRRALAPWFATGEPVPGAYLYRHKIGAEHRADEERRIAAGELPATGARFVAVRG
jgi:SAM-dependent methyltransferase